jgi:hypothetical protein
MDVMYVGLGNAPDRLDGARDRPSGSGDLRGAGRGVPQILGELRFLVAHGCAYLDTAG